jgi:hypothetical protein
MRKFNTVGKTVVVRGTVKRKWREDGDALLELDLRSEVRGETTVGPGTVTVALPGRDAPPRRSN